MNSSRQKMSSTHTGIIGSRTSSVSIAMNRPITLHMLSFASNHSSMDGYWKCDPPTRPDPAVGRIDGSSSYAASISTSLHMPCVHLSFEEESPSRWPTDGPSKKCWRSAELPDVCMQQAREYLNGFQSILPWREDVRADGNMCEGTHGVHGCNTATRLGARGQSSEHLLCPPSDVGRCSRRNTSGLNMGGRSSAVSPDERPACLACCRS
ncbi:hypothetical protein C8Q80DRAFT_1155791 [Daedaleopsis nitida]|nr:hypothetical protein C8Q80DRAFT_1155791 [Daedaleopsis nitida]